MSDKLALDIFFIVVVVIAFLLPILVIYQSVRESHQNTADFPESSMRREAYGSLRQMGDTTDKIEQDIQVVKWKLHKIEEDVEWIRRRLHDKKMAESRKTDTT